MYNSHHFVTLVLCLFQMELFLASFHNVPGCCNNSQVAHREGLYDTVEAVYNTPGLKMVIDSAFFTTNSEFLINLSQEFMTVDVGMQLYQEKVANLAFKPDATSMLHSAEWGVKAVQSSFPRLKDTLVYEENGEQKINFTSLFFLYNLGAL